MTRNYRTESKRRAKEKLSLTAYHRSPPESEETSQEAGADRPPPPVEGEGKPKRPRACRDGSKAGERVARKGGKAAHSAELRTSSPARGACSGPQGRDDPCEAPKDRQGHSERTSATKEGSGG